MLEKALNLELKTLQGCPLCGKADSRRAFDLGVIQVFRCAQCGLSYLNPCLDAGGMAASYESSESLVALNDFHAGYYEYGSLQEDTRTLREFNRSLDALERHLGPVSSKSLFEIGSGNGLFLAAARQRGWTVAGVESSKRNVDLAREKFSIALDCGLFEEFQAGGQACDAVAMLDVLEHRSDPNDFLGKAVARIRKGGLILVAVPNHASMLWYLSKLMLKLGGEPLSFGLKKVYLLEHVCYYDKRTLGKLFARNGIEPLEYFQSSTDLAKYRLRPLEKCMAASVLSLGKMTGMQNRLIAVGRRA